MTTLETEPQTTLTFGILGPLEIRRDGALCHVGRQKSRQLLATLLLHPNRFISTDLITDVLWGESPPRSASANIRTYVHALRNCLTDPADPPLIETHTAGYSINVTPDALDSSVFQRLAAEAERHARDGDRAGALRIAERAHALWRGHPLDDLPVAAAWQVTLDKLDHARREVLDTLVDLWLEFGRHHPARALLSERIREDPYSEPLWCRYITCLATMGRADEARKAAAEIRGLLSQEFGLAPGEELSELEARLNAATPVAVPQWSPAAPSGGPPSRGRVPSQLPLDVADFTGRAAELESLRALLSGEDAHHPPVAVISGPPGAGKTAFAVHLGHQLRDSFPDGQLYLDMRATTEPREPAAALAEMLRSLGLPDAAIPADSDRRSALLRSELAGRRVLMMLDDAASAEQVAPLLPGTGNSAVLITSRLRLTDLAGVTHRTLSELHDDEAAALLGRIVGDGRVPADSDETREVLRTCGNLPLAIRIAGSRLVQRCDLSAADLVLRLRDEHRRLDELRVGNLAVRSSADLSYQLLSETEARMYRLVGLLGAGELPAWLLNESGIGVDPEGSVGALLEANLVQLTRREPANSFHYRIHDLLRCHALELAESEASGQAREDVDRVLNLFLARSLQQVAELPIRFFGITLDTADLDAGSGADSMPPAEWLDNHRQVFGELISVAVRHGLDDLGWRLAVAWAPHLDLRAHYDEWDRSHHAAVECARRAGARRGEATLLRNLGQLAIYRDEYAAAERSLTSSYDIFESIADDQGCGVAAVGLGTYHRETADDTEALRWYHVALDRFVSARDRHGEAVARNAIAGIWLQRARPEQAEPWLRAAFGLSVETGDSHREAQVRRRLAILHQQQGDPQQAARELQTALDILTDLGDDHCASYVRRSLGELLAGRGELVAARRMLLLALDVGHRLGDRRAEALAAVQLGRLHKVMGNAESAQQYFRRAWRTWQPVVERITSPGRQARIRGPRPPGRRRPGRA